MKLTVIGCGRWGSLIAWYLDRIGHEVVLYGRDRSDHMQAFLKTRSNGQVTLPQSITLSTNLWDACHRAELLLLSVPSQKLRAFLAELRSVSERNPGIVLCMKGLEAESGKRLSEIAGEELPVKTPIAVWLGPGHVQQFLSGVPNCMVIDSKDGAFSQSLVTRFSGDLIRFYCGQDLLGNEIGAATKNVIGIAAGMLDGLGLSPLKGALMSRGTHEISELIENMGGNPFSAYGLCHLGDYEATVFSPYSHNRQFGESFVLGKPYGELAEGYATAAALQILKQRYGAELPICCAVYRILYEHADPREELNQLFRRQLKREWGGTLASDLTQNGAKGNGGE